MPDNAQKYVKIQKSTHEFLRQIRDWEEECVVNGKPFVTVIQNIAGMYNVEWQKDRMTRRLKRQVDQNRIEINLAFQVLKNKYNSSAPANSNIFLLQNLSETQAEIAATAIYEAVEAVIIRIENS